MGRGEFVLPLTAELGRVLAPGREIFVRWYEMYLVVSRTMYGIHQYAYAEYVLYCQLYVCILCVTVYVYT